MARLEVDELDPVPNKKNIMIYCDESGTHGAPYYGFGSLWITHERRGNFTGWLNDVRTRHGMNDEIKWNKVNARNLEFYKEVVSGILRSPSAMFHCLVVKKSDVDRKFHKGMEDAMRKHLTMFLSKKIAMMTKHRSDRVFRVRIDQLPFSYSKSGEVIEKIGNHLISKYGGNSEMDVRERDSKKMAGIQVADLLLGAVLNAWNQAAVSSPKLEVSAHLARLLGWQDLRADTFPREWKFNIWAFRGSSETRPRERTRSVQLVHRMPSFRFGSQ